MIDMRMYSTSRMPGEDDDSPLVKDVAFNRKSFGLDSHLSPYDNGMIQIGTDGIEVALIQGIHEDDLKRVLASAEMATIGMTLDDMHAVTEGSPDEGNEMFKGGLQTALESQVIVFGVKGVSRTCTHQLVRTRKAAFHQQSQRASYMGDLPEVRVPDSIWRSTPEVRRAWMEAIYAAAQAYRMAVGADVSYQDARFILPEGTTNFIMLEYPIREFLNVYAYRACSMFQWEISHVMRECRRVLVAAHPWIEPYVKISCETTHGAKDRFLQESYEEQQNPDNKRNLPGALDHTCTFQGWEEVEHQCHFPWARETNRSFRSDKHTIKKVEK